MFEIFGIFSFQLGFRGLVRGLGFLHLHPFSFPESFEN
jgi:hypothetical protein